MCVVLTDKLMGEGDKVKTNWTRIFKKPLKPKLPRKIVKSAKLNLNRYWNKLEELWNLENTPSILNNRPAQYCQLDFIPNNKTPLDGHDVTPDEITNYMSKKFSIEKNLAKNGRYKHFQDDSLYHGVNLNFPPEINTDLSLYQQQQQQQVSFCPLCPFGCPNTNTAIMAEDKENLENELMELFQQNLYPYYVNYNFYDN